jgi:segregation and condensation protein A
MAASADPIGGLAGAAGELGPGRETPGDRPAAAASKAPPAEPVDDGPERGKGGSPSLTLEGFSGPLDHLLTLARAQKIDLFAISLGALIAQLTAALHGAPSSVTLGQKADWVVMAAWLVQLRTRLLLPAEAPGRHEAAVEAGQLRERLVALEEVQALTFWLERRPQLGHDVFVRGHPPSRAQSPEMFGMSVEAGPPIEVIEFLWASLALFDDLETPETRAQYRPRPIELYAVAEARDRIRRRLAETPDGASLDRFLPDPSDPLKPPENAALADLRRRSAWSSTFVAGLELAKQGEVVLEQGEDFDPIQVASTGRQSPP